VPVELTADSIAEAAQQPASATVDGKTAAAHPLPDQLEVLKFKAAEAATTGTNAGGGRKSAWRSAVTGRAVPPGAAP
jgi:hypothetical protein